MHDVITIGGAAYDAFIYTNPKTTKIIKQKMPEKELIAYPTGAKILIDQACFDIGGGATNAATAFRRLGLKTGCICKVGNDTFGKQILNCLKNEGIYFLGNTGKDHTDFSIILDSKGHDRTVLVFKGAGLKLMPRDFKSDLDTKWLYISSSIGTSFETSVKISAQARKKGVKVAFNPSTYLARKGHVYLKKILANTDALVLNKEEAMMISGKKTIKDMLNKLSDYGPETVAITDGPEGAFCLHQQKIYEVLPRKAKVVETTGAGDAFASSLIAGLIMKKDIEYCLQLSIANAESVISNFGAHNKLLKLKEAELKIKNKPIKIKKMVQNGKKFKTDIMVQ